MCFLIKINQLLYLRNYGTLFPGFYHLKLPESQLRLEKQKFKKLVHVSSFEYALCIEVSFFDFDSR